MEYVLSLYGMLTSKECPRLSQCAVIRPGSTTVAVNLRRAQASRMVRSTNSIDMRVPSFSAGTSRSSRSFTGSLASAIGAAATRHTETSEANHGLLSMETKLGLHPPLGNIPQAKLCTASLRNSPMLLGSLSYGRQK